ncbi:MAG: TIGR02302 family protein [Alphaproteobacteria bacterium]|nr:TIGR02302 family protein [Alphaproteobacteria bacterium]
MSDSDAAARLRRQLRQDRRLLWRMRLARAALLWERAWPAAWPAVCVIGVFAVLALFDLLPAMPGWLHAGVLAVLAAALAAAIAWGMFRRAEAPVWSDPAAARRRIERASGLAHRPLQALLDQPSAPLDRAAAGLWAAHRHRMEAAIRRLRVGWPVAGLARHDPWGVRSVLAIVVLLGVIDAGADWRERAARALSPNFAGGAATVASSFDLWITPPEYTGLAPQFLRAGEAGPIQVPTGSVLLAQVHGGGSLPRLAIDSESRDLQAVDKQNFRIETTLTSGQTLAVTQGHTMLGRWAIEIVPDNPPAIAFAQPPKGTARAALRLDYHASDDYGVETAKAVIRLAGSKPSEGSLGEPIELELPLPGLHLKDAQATSYHDLSPHPWAGLPVEIRLVATDALGQTGESEPVRMTLPERVFNHPIARAIIDQRKELAKDPNSADAVAEILGDLNKRPVLYRDDTAVFLALHMAQLRLSRGHDKDTISVVQQILWETALRIEDGRMAMAEQDLRRLQQQLQDALAKGAPDEEIERLMSELRQALDRYLQSLAEELQRHPDEATQPVDPSRMITGRDLQRMLDRAREMARSGARDQAREMLSQLQNMLENLRTARPGQMPRGSSEAQQMMRGLQELMQRQQQLLDKSFRAQRQQGQQGQQGQQNRAGQPGQPGRQQDATGDNGEMGDEAGEQEGLRHSLGDLMRRLGEGMGDIPDPFGRAERAMRDATGALQRGQPSDAIGPQTEALDQLQQAARDFAQQLRQRLGKGWGGDDEVGATDRDQRGRIERDPFGRPTSSDGTYDQSDVRIPDESTLQKSRQILDELRRRAGERSRPSIELDYIERLLKRF